MSEEVRVKCGDNCSLFACAMMTYFANCTFLAFVD